MTRKRLGEVLIDQGLIDDEDLQQALSYQEKSGYRLGTSLVALRIIAEWQLTEALGKALDVEVVDLHEIQPEPEALARLPSTLAERYDLIPIRMDAGADQGKVLVVAMSDPLNRSTIQRIEHAAECPLRPVLASLSAIQRAIRIYYHGASPGTVMSEASRLKTEQERPCSSGNVLKTATLNWLRQEVEALSGGKPGIPSGAGLDKELATRLRFEALLQALEEKQLLNKKEFAEHLARLLDERTDPAC